MVCSKDCKRISSSSRNSNPLVIGFGYKALSGKDECVKHLAKVLKANKVCVTSFAKTLRSEIHKEMHSIAIAEHISPRDALKELCYRAGVPYESEASASKSDPHGKQRALLQWWGTEYRRESDKEYWIRKVAQEIAQKSPSVVLISDVRFPNEFDFVKSLGGYMVNIHRLGIASLKGAVAEHSSENYLAHYAFDFTLENDSDIKTLHSRARDLFTTITNLHTQG